MFCHVCTRDTGTRTRQVYVILRGRNRRFICLQASKALEVEYYKYPVTLSTGLVSPQFVSQSGLSIPS